MYVELKNINKTFGNYKASDNVNFTIEQGKLIGLLGPSGKIGRHTSELQSHSYLPTAAKLLLMARS